MNPSLALDRRSLLALLGSTAAWTAGDALAQDAPRKGGVLRVACPANASSLDPTTGNNGSDHVFLYTMFDTLVEWDFATLNAKPGLAESWLYPDPTTLVLNIRAGVQFHDGTPCDAAAVKYNLDRSRTHERSTLRADLATIAEITVTSPLQVTVKLKQPDTALPLILADRAGMMSSPKAVEALGREHDRKPVGTGQWKLKSWVDNERITVERNPNYWKPGLPYLDGVDFQVIPEVNTGLRSVTAGQNDYVYFLSPQQKTLVDRAKSLTSVLGPTLWYVKFYINFARPPMNDVRVRLAMNYAVDREELNKATFSGLGEPTGISLPKSHWAHDPEMAKFYRYDPDYARKLLAEAGHNDGIALTAISYTEQLSVQIQEVLIEQVRRAGIRLSFQRYTGPETTAVFFTEKKGDMFLSAWTGRPDPSLTYQLLFAKDSYFNAGRVEGAAGLTEALAATRVSADPAERRAAFAKLQRIVTENALAVPLMFQPEFDAMIGKVKGYRPNLLGKPKFEDVFLAS